MGSCATPRCRHTHATTLLQEMQQSRAEDPMIENILMLAALLGIGGVVFVAAGMGFIRFLDILENDYD